MQLDANPNNADWCKLAWDLPPYKSAEFLVLVPDLEGFKKLPIYKWAQDKKLIVNDEWAKKNANVVVRLKA